MKMLLKKIQVTFCLFQQQSVTCIFLYIVNYAFMLALFAKLSIMSC